MLMTNSKVCESAPRANGLSMLERLVFSAQKNGKWPSEETDKYNTKGPGYQTAMSPIHGIGSPLRPYRMLPAQDSPTEAGSLADSTLSSALTVWHVAMSCDGPWRVWQQGQALLAHAIIYSHFSAVHSLQTMDLDVSSSLPVIEARGQK